MIAESPARMPGPPAARPASSDNRDVVDRLLAWRDRLLASPRFQHAAARFAPTRWIARRRSRALFDLVAGFAYSQVLAACVRLDLFDPLLERPRTRAELGAHTGLDDDRIERLLAAAIALDLIERRRGGRYGLGRLGAPLAGNRAIASMVEHHAALYADLADPVALLRRPAPSRDDAFDGSGSSPSHDDERRSATAPQRQRTTNLNGVWGYAANDDAKALDDARVAAYSSLMTASQPLVAAQILDAYPLQRHRGLLDAGGGEGAFAIEVARRHARLAIRVFDLPAVAARARDRVAAAGLANRIETIGGDFVRDALPQGADIVTLVRVIHDHDDDRALRILRNAWSSLPDGGVLLLAEPMSCTRGAEPMGDAYFGMYLLAMGSGRPRTPQRLTALLRESGFARVRLLRTSLPLQTRVIAAWR